MVSRLMEHPNKTPWILDGPMGTEIERRGGDTTLPLWSSRALLDAPELVKNIHIDYIAAGAEIITTNTFRTQYRTLQRAGIGNKAEDLTHLAVDLSVEAKNELNTDTIIAGSIAPLEECYSPQLVPADDILLKEHKIMTSWLANTEAIDLFLIETMNTAREALAAVQACEGYNLPIWMSLTCDNEGNILGNDDWENIIEPTRNIVDVVLINCTSIQGTVKAIEKISAFNVPRLGMYPNFGQIDPITGWKAESLPDIFDTYIKSWLKLNPFVLGTCCGATPKDTLRLKHLVEFHPFSQDI